MKRLRNVPFKTSLHSHPYELTGIYRIDILSSMCGTNKTGSGISIGLWVKRYVFSRCFHPCFWSENSIYVDRHIAYHGCILRPYNEDIYPQAVDIAIAICRLLPYSSHYPNGCTCIIGASLGSKYSSYSISQEICIRFLLCCALLWLYIDWFPQIHQAYFTGTVAI